MTLKAERIRKTLIKIGHTNPETRLDSDEKKSIYLWHFKSDQQLKWTFIGNSFEVAISRIIVDFNLLKNQKEQK